MESTDTAAQGVPGHRDLSAVDLEVLVGRSHEISVLENLLDRAEAGSGGAVLLDGSAGLGKSRLLAEAAARARSRGIRVLDARAIGSEQDFPFAVALQLFEPTLAAAGRDSGLLDGAAGLVGPLFSGDYDLAARGSPFPMRHGLFWLTVNIAQSGPLVLCLDDAQWCDDASLSFVNYLIRRIEGVPIAVVVAARPGGSGRGREALGALRESWSGDRLELAPLTTDEVSEIVRDRLPGADDTFCAACAEVAHGNPFYVREVLRSVCTEHLEPTARYSERLREVTFASLSRASLFRLARLGPDPIHLARALAVLGDGTPLRRAAALADLDLIEAAAAADALVGDELVVGGATLAFAHPLVAQLVHDEMPAVQGAVLHGRAARLLADENAAPEAVAAHLLLTPGDGAAWVVQMLRLAARRAQAKGASASAARLLARALDEPPAAAIRADVLAELGTAEAAAGIEQGVQHLREALDLRTDLAGRTETRRELARALASIGQRREAAQTLEAALNEAPDDAEQTEALMADFLVNSVFEPGLRQHGFTRMEALLSGRPTGVTATERAILAPMAMRSGQDGERTSRTIELAERAWGGGALLAEQGVGGPGWLMIVWAVELAGDHRRAEEVALAAMDLARRSGSLAAFATASMFCGWARSAMGRIVDAQADIEQAVGAAQSGWRRYLVAALASKANLHVFCGELAAADDALALAAQHDHGGGLEVPWRLHACGRLAMARHEPADALRLFTEAGDWLADELGVDYTVLSWRSDAALAALALGDGESARELIAPDLALARRSTAPGHLGRATRVLGLIEGGDEGMGLLRDACAHFANGGEVLERAVALTDLGAMLRRSGARAESRPYLAEALDVAVRIGAAAAAERARDELSASGARRQAEQTSGPNALTPSEKRVADLVSGGLSNTQVAQALFVTPKTIEYHLRHVYQKLAITGRTEIAAALGPSS